MDSKYRIIEEELDLSLILKNIFLFLQKNLRRIVFFSVAGILLGVGLFISLPKSYESRMMADSGILPNAEIINIIESWQNLIKKGDFQALATILQLDYQTTAKILRLEASNTSIPNTPVVTDKENQNSFIIDVLVADPQIVDKLQEAIIRSLENNDFIKKRIAIKKENLESLKQRILSEITDLDSVKNSVKDLLRNGGTGSSSTFLTDPANVNLQIVTLYEKVLEINASIKLIEDIQIIEPFTRSDKPDNPKLIVCLAIGFTIGLFLFFVLALIQAIRSKVEQLAS